MRIFVLMLTVLLTVFTACSKEPVQNVNSDLESAVAPMGAQLTEPLGGVITYPTNPSISVDFCEITTSDFFNCDCNKIAANGDFDGDGDIDNDDAILLGMILHYLDTNQDGEVTVDDGYNPIDFDGDGVATYGETWDLYLAANSAQNFDLSLNGVLSCSDKACLTGYANNSGNCAN